MSAEKDQSRKPPNVRKFGDTSAAKMEWEYTHTDLVDKVIILISIIPVETQFGNAYVGRTVVEGREVSVLFGGMVLCKQLGLIERELPVEALLTKPGNYYLLVDPGE